MFKKIMYLKFACFLVTVMAANPALAEDLQIFPNGFDKDMIYNFNNKNTKRDNNSWFNPSLPIPQKKEKEDGLNSLKGFDSNIGGSWSTKPNKLKDYRKGKYLGNLSSNPYNPDSISNPYGKGNPYNPDSITNPYGQYGNQFSPNSWTNPYATQTPRLYDSYGNYKGKLSTNPYDPDSISNTFGRYGSPFSPDSINNPYGGGNRYSPDSPNNPYGQGWEIIGED